MSIASVGSATANPYLDSLLQSTKASQTSGVAALLAAVNSGSGSSAVSGTSRAGGDSVSISSPSKLFSQLQQLEQQDPAKFKEVTADIASKLKAASTQATGGLSTFLSDLASKFDTASTTGDAAGLAPTHRGHHAHQPHGTYNAQGQAAPPPPPDLTGASASGGTDLKALFATISQEVTQALAA